MIDLEVDFGVQEQVDRPNGPQQLIYGEDELQACHVISTTNIKDYIPLVWRTININM